MEASRSQCLIQIAACGTSGPIALFRQVKTGITGTTDIEILDGVAENDDIVSGPYQVLRTLKDNTRIKIEKAP